MEFRPDSVPVPGIKIGPKPADADFWQRFPKSGRNNFQKKKYVKKKKKMKSKLGNLKGKLINSLVNTCIKKTRSYYICNEGSFICVILNNEKFY